MASPAPSTQDLIAEARARWVNGLTFSDRDFPKNLAQWSPEAMIAALCDRLEAASLPPQQQVDREPLREPIARLRLLAMGVGHQYTGPDDIDPGPQIRADLKLVLDKLDGGFALGPGQPSLSGGEGSTTPSRKET